MAKKTMTVEVDTIDLNKVIELASLSIRVQQTGVKLMISVPKNIALSLAFIGLDSFIEVIAR